MKFGNTHIVTDQNSISLKNFKKFKKKIKKIQNIQKSSEFQKI